MKKILVVDDDRSVCEVLKKFLIQKGYEATTALSGEEAIVKIKQDTPHIVLLDIKMPGMGGLETLKKIREINKDIGIVMITAVKDEETGRKCLELGAYDYIAKPLSLDYLETVLMVKLVDFT